MSATKPDPAGTDDWITEKDFCKVNKLENSRPVFDLNKHTLLFELRKLLVGLCLPYITNLNIAQNRKQVTRSNIFYLYDFNDIKISSSHFYRFRKPSVAGNSVKVLNQK